MYEYIHTIPRADQERAGKIRTFTGKYVNPWELRATDIDIVDIATHLSIEPRYLGANGQPYCVAQHCVLGTEYFKSPLMKLAFLLHDSAEAYFKDMPSPIKAHPSMAAYKRQEHETVKLIFCCFGIDPKYLAATKEVDDIMFRREVANWWGDPSELGVIDCWDSFRARNEYLTLFHTFKHQLMLEKQLWSKE